MAAGGGFDGASLKKYWLTGKGAVKIRWGTPGDFTRCVRLVRQAADGEMTDQQAKGYCANLHHAATGMWPGDRDNK